MRQFWPRIRFSSGAEIVIINPTISHNFPERKGCFVIRLLIIADDFTGALDTGVQLAKQGVPTRVTTDREADLSEAGAGCDVLVVDSETRHLPPREAYQIVYGLTARTKALSIPHIMKKTDSALRGNIGAELSAVLDASKADFLPFFPALPEMGRITVGGIHYIGETPVAQSPFGQDPFEPVQSSSVPEIIAGQTDLPVHVIGENQKMDLQNTGGIAVFDAKSQDALARAAGNLAQKNALSVMAGCAGLGGTLKDILSLNGERPAMPPLSKGLLMLCGSVNPITRAQLLEADRAGYAHIHLGPEEKLTEGFFETEAGLTRIRQFQETLARNPFLIIDANDAVEDNEPTRAYAQARGLSTDDLRVLISGALGLIMRQLMKGTIPGSLLITGGDTLMECMKRLGVSRMEPIGELSAGVVYSRFQYEQKDYCVISKSGGFGRETLLSDLKNDMEQGR